MWYSRKLTFILLPFFMHVEDCLLAPQWNILLTWSGAKNSDRWNQRKLTVSRFAMKQCQGSYSCRCIIIDRNKTELNWKSLSCVWLSEMPWTIQSMKFSRPEFWHGWPFPSLSDLPNPGIEPRPPALLADSLLSEPRGSPDRNKNLHKNIEME